MTQEIIYVTLPTAYPLRQSIFMAQHNYMNIGLDKIGFYTYPTREDCDSMCCVAIFIVKLKKAAV